MTALSTQPHTHDHIQSQHRSQSQLQRLAAAKAALAVAETKQGLRSVDTAHRADTPITYAAQAFRPQNPFALIPGGATQADTSSTDTSSTDATPTSKVGTPKNTSPKSATPLIRADRDTIAVHNALTTLLPHGLTPGSITTTQGSTHTALTLITQHTTNAGWVAIIGAPNINYTTLQDLGANLNHIIVVPHPNENTPQIIAALIEGVDLILLGPAVTLTHAEQRTLTARNRERGTHIISQKPWANARTHITTTHGTWHGTNKGLGRLTNTTYTLTKTDPSGHHATTITTHNGQLKNPHHPTPTHITRERTA